MPIIRWIVLIGLWFWFRDAIQSVFFMVILYSFFGQHSYEVNFMCFDDEDIWADDDDDWDDDDWDDDGE